MAWYEGSNAGANIPFDWNQHYAETLMGELDEETARSTLGHFLMYNIGFCVYLLTGFHLDPDQRVILKGWMQKNFTLCIAGRSWSKSFLLGHFFYLYCLFNADHHVLMTSATFRSSRKVLENIETWADRKRKVGMDEVNYPGGELLKETIKKIEKKPDMVRITFKNGSTITAVPLGDPDNLRGFRCNVLAIDEGLLIPQSTIDLVLKPFLAGGADIGKKQRIRRKEKKLIELGEMREEERQQFKSTSKMIISSSASYKWEELYETYKKYRAIIAGGDDKHQAEKTDKGNASTYLVQQLSYKVAPEDRLDAAILEEIKEGLIPENIIKREYEAQFIDESGGYFSAREMAQCTIPQGSRPCVEVVGEKGAKYVLGIDPSMGASATDDHFAMCVIKIVKRPGKNPGEERDVGLVVHQYGCAGVELKQHIAYLYYILARFNIVYIICDTSSGDSSDFVNICNESEYFKARKVELNPIDADFSTETFDEIVKQVQRSYNPDSSLRRIVQKQYFSSSFLKAANEYLRAAFDQKLLWFASHAASVENVTSQMCHQDVLGIHESHPEYQLKDDKGQTMGNMFEFVNYQDQMIERVKKECALIEVTSTPLGHLSYDLPHHMTRNRKNERRNRKDNYSALLLANWAFKIHIGAQALPPQEQEDEFLARWV